jgi:hypothetical protein
MKSLLPDSTPIKRVSAKKYPPKDRAAKMRFRIKGETDGPIYEGQKIILPCKGCGKPAAPVTGSARS